MPKIMVGRQNMMRRLFRFKRRELRVVSRLLHRNNKTGQDLMAKAEVTIRIRKSLPEVCGGLSDGSVSTRIQMGEGRVGGIM